MSCTACVRRTKQTCKLSCKLIGPQDKKGKKDKKDKKDKGGDAAPQEVLPGAVMFPTSLYRTLVSNASVAISFDTSATAETEVQVSFMITNNSSAKIGPMSLAIVDDDKNKAVRPEGSTDDLEVCIYPSRNN